MTVSVVHASQADASFSAQGATNWNAGHNITGLANAVAFFNSAGNLADSANLTFNSGTGVLTAPTVTGTTQLIASALGSVTAPSLRVGTNTGTGWAVTADGVGLAGIANGAFTAQIYPNGAAGFSMQGSLPIGWIAAGFTGTTAQVNDTALSRISAGVVGVGTGAQGSVAGSLSLTNATLAGYESLIEMTAPAGVANHARLFAQDNGGGKTQLMVIFGSGVAQQIAVEA